jgi:hypothetical protein
MESHYTYIYTYIYLFYIILDIQRYSDKYKSNEKLQFRIHDMKTGKISTILSNKQRHSLQSFRYIKNTR